MQLGPGSEADALEFCARQPEHTLVIAGWLGEGGLRRSDKTQKAWLFAEQDEQRRVQGLVYVSDNGIVLPVLRSRSALDALVELGARNPQVIRVVVGERSTVDHLLRAWVPRGFRPRLHRDQLAYVVGEDGFSPHGNVELRPAEPEDLDALVEASAEMAREEAGDDPQARNPGLFRSRIKKRIERGRDFVLMTSQGLSFKSNVAALSSFGGQVEGIFVPPAHRQQGLGLKGTSWVTRWILDRAPRACLLVNEDNQGAKRLYLRLGYVLSHSSRTSFFA
ncbi:MAG: GNAT family N-acetyltransferase [Myxococcota bacterium]